MKYTTLHSFYFLLFSVLGFQILGGQTYANNLHQSNSNIKKNIICFSPEISPPLEEIRAVTNDSFFSVITNRYAHFRNSNVLRIDTPLLYENVDTALVSQIITNNDADYAIVPKVKFFKVGIGSYVFSSQVVVSMKLYNSEGQLMTESTYDTLRKNARIFGSAENSIKKGTEGALKNIMKFIRKQKHQ